MQVSSTSKQYTVLINAVEWLVCKYSHPGEASVYSKKVGVFQVHLQRPMIQGGGYSMDTCPTNTIATEVASLCAGALEEHEVHLDPRRHLRH